MVIIAIYKGVDNREGITKESKISSSITKLRKYFEILYPNSKVDNCNPVIKIDLDGQEEALKEEAEYERDQSLEKLIQLGSTRNQYYIHNLSYGCDLGFGKSYSNKKG